MENNLEVIWSGLLEEIWAYTDAVTYIMRSMLLGWATSPGTSVLGLFFHQSSLPLALKVSATFDIMREG